VTTHHGVGAESEDPAPTLAVPWTRAGLLRALATASRYSRLPGNDFTKRGGTRP
jgi:hypothetical protein